MKKCSDTYWKIVKFYMKKNKNTALEPKLIVKHQET